MKSIFCCLLLLASASACAQSIKGEQNASPNRRQLLQAHQVSISVNAVQSPSFQANNWKAETMANPKNATAWLNYYLWTSREKTLAGREKQETLAHIATQAEQHANRSTAVYLIRYLQSAMKDSAALYQAFATSEDKALVYPYLIQHAVLTNNRPAIARHATAFERLSPLSPALTEYYHNLLMSADSGTVVYAQGINDLSSIAIVQQQGIRPDVTLKYYGGQPLEKNAYLCLSLGKETLQQHPAASFSGLLAAPGSKVPVEQILQKLEQQFIFQFLDGATALQPEVAVLYKNYLPSFLLLYRYLKENNESSTAQWEARILKIARWSGSEAAIQNLLTN